MCDFQVIPRYYVLLLLLVVLPLGSPKDETDDHGSHSHADHVKKDPASEPSPRKHVHLDFVKQDLVVDDLWGSRWAIEHQQQIDVLHSIEIVDATLMDKGQLSLRVEFYIRQRWVADGLEFPKGLFKADDSEDVYLSAKETVLKHMWNPNSYISTSRQSSIAVSSAPINTIHIYQNNTIIYKARLHTIVACSSDFRWFPVDKQACYLQIDSYKFSDKYVSYQWDNSFYSPLISKVDRLMQYDATSAITENGTKSRGGRGEKYPFVRVRFIFERKLGNIMMQVYIPTFLTVSLSWFGFWLALDAIKFKLATVPARVALIITCMLTLITMHTSMKASGPPVHYITAMDVWMVACITMVFGAIFQFVVIKYMMWTHHLKEAEDKKKEEEKKAKAKSETVSEAETTSTVYSQPESVKLSAENPLVPLLPLKEGVNAPLDSQQNLTARGNTAVQYQYRRETVPLDLSISVMPPPFIQLEKNIDKTVSKETTSNTSQDQEQDEKSSGRMCEWCQFYWGMEKKPWDKIDKFCRVAFPAIFIAFNCVYWPVLLRGSANQRVYLDSEKE